MIVLANQTTSIAIKLGAPVSFADSPIFVCYKDSNETRQKSEVIMTNGANWVLACSAPQSDVTRSIELLQITNKDNADISVTVLYDNTNSGYSEDGYPLVDITLNPDDTLAYNDHDGWKCIDKDGNIKGIGIQGPPGPGGVTTYPLTFGYMLSPGSFDGGVAVTLDWVSPLTTKGDLFVFGATDTRLGVGTNGQVLTADSAEATGLKWTTVAGGGETLAQTLVFGKVTGGNDIEVDYLDGMLIKGATSTEDIRITGGSIGMDFTSGVVGAIGSIYSTGEMSWNYTVQAPSMGCYTDFYLGSTSSYDGAVWFTNASNANFLKLKSGATANDITYILPITDPTAGQVLTATLPILGISTLSWSTVSGGGTVTAVSVASANGFAGSSTGGATPALTISISVTGVLKGNGTAISAATAGTDYSLGTSANASGLVFSTTTTGALTAATDAQVTAYLLTGLSITGSTIAPSDRIIDAFGKLQNQINGVLGGAIYQGVWNATTNSPALTSSVGTKGYYYVVNVAGSTNLNGVTDWKVGDWAIFNGTAWEKVDNTDAVSSVNSAIGSVVITTTGTNNRISVTGGSGLTPTIDIDAAYDALWQPIDADLTAIAALGFASTSFLKKTAANTWALDTNTYITGLAIGTTPITSGTVGRILFEGAGSVVNESANLFWDDTNSQLSLLGAGTAALPTIGIGAVNLGFYMPVADELGLVTGGTARYRFSSTAINSVTTNSFTMRRAAGAVATPTYAFNGTVNTGMWLNGTFLDFSVAGLAAGGFSGSGIFKLYNAGGTFGYNITAANLAADRTLNIPLLTTTDTFAMVDFAQTLTNKTMTGTNNTLTARLLKSATTEVDVSAATAPSIGQVLTATSSTAATWQTPSGGLTQQQVEGLI